MTKLNSAIAIAALTSASSVSCVTALSLQRQPMHHNHASSGSSRRIATITQWMMPNNVKTAFGQAQQRSSSSLPFYAIMEKPKDGSSNSSEEEKEKAEAEDDEKAWEVPSPPENRPPKPIITEARAALAEETQEENLLGEKIASEIINPLIVNPSIEKNVPKNSSRKKSQKSINQ